MDPPRYCVGTYAKDAKELRSGFTAGLYNSRGVHGFSEGREERQLAAQYRQKAEILEKHGFDRVGAVVRELAESYEREALREAERDPFDSVA